MFARYHNYPHHQVLKLSQQFDNPKLSEHISHAIAFELKATLINPNDKLKRDVRKVLYNKVNVGGDSSSPSMSSSNSSVIELTEGGESVLFSEKVDPFYYKQELDLFEILSRCHEASDRTLALVTAAKEYENPVLILLASVYEVSK